jgi:hypothetical protein
VLPCIRASKLLSGRAIAYELMNSSGARVRRSSRRNLVICEGLIDRRLPQVCTWVEIIKIQ